MRFSQRKGLTPISDIIHINDITDTLRISIWNVFDLLVWSTSGFTYDSYHRPKIRTFAKALWFEYFKKPIDTIPYDGSDILNILRKYFFESDWYEVYDFIEYALNYFNDEQLDVAINNILERELSGYRFVAGSIVDITNKQEIEMLESAIYDDKYKSVSKHLQRALELLSDRDNPDYRNSIKESISAVESIAKIITGIPNATLGDAVKILEKTGKLHTALKEGFSKLYGYTSDEDGIRHAMIDEPNITASDAKYFLLSCTSFINYLKSKV